MGELTVSLSHDSRGPDAEAGNHQHEHGPNEYKEHGNSPLPTLKAALSGAVK